MKKLLSLTAAVILGIGTMFANPVDVNTAKSVGQKFVQNKFELTRSANLELVYTFSVENEASLYVFDVDNNGFVVVSADDSFRPIVGYSDEGPFNVENMSPEMNYYLTNMAQGRHQLKGRAVDPIVVEEWESVQKYGRLHSFNGGKGDEYLCQTKWDQNPAPYNSMCPADPLGPGGHDYVGCVATAMSQIMKYWNYPIQGQGSHSYVCNANPYAGYPGHPEYGTLTANFGATTYDWANMLNSYTGSYTPEQGNAVATLCYHCGVAVDMMYGNTQDNGSGAYSADVPGAISSYFRYSTAATIRNYTNNPTNWANMLKEQIDLGWPVYHSGSSSEGGHAFVCDGYNDEDMFHYNWGWGGSGNNVWYVVNEIDYSTSMAAIINFVPADVYSNTAQAPTNVTATKTSDIAQEATITWTNPTKTLNNQTISSIDHMVVTRNGAVIYTSENATPGASMSYVDTDVPCYSTFEYAVYAVIDGANGTPGKATASFGPTCSWTIVATADGMQGWKGGKLIAYDGAGNEITSFTMTNSNPVSTSINITLGKVLFAWKKGTDDVTLSFKLKNANGDVVYNFPQGSSSTIPEGYFYVGNNGCGNAAPTNAPGTLHATTDGDNVVLSWSGNTKDVLGYNIYRDGILIELAHDTEFVDENPGMGGHCYSVCYLGDGGESPLSNEACANAGEGCLPGNNLWYTVQSNNNKPIISWEAPSNSSGLSGYFVYRKKAGEDYKNVKILGPNKTEYKETNTLEDETLYSYKVVAYYQSVECYSAPIKARYGNKYYIDYYYAIDGVDEVMAQTVNIYPNPAKDVLTVKAENISSVVIYNSIGQKVFEQKFNSDKAVIDMNDFMTGIYMVRVVANGNEITKKVSVVR